MLAVKHPKAKLIPNVLVDELWHQHVLDTRQYPKDCNRVFGGFMHHDPYFGTTSEGEQQLPVLFTETNRLFCAEFGENCITAEPMAELLQAAKSCNGGGDD